MSTAMEDQIWREIGALESDNKDLRERLDVVERRASDLARRSVAVAIIEGLFNIAWLICVLWLLSAAAGWMTHRAGNHACEVSARTDLIQQRGMAMTSEGNNSAPNFKHRVEQINNLLDEIAERQLDIKLIKEGLKNDGYNTKAVNKVLRELRMGAEKYASQLELELEVDTYRRNVGLALTYEEAAKNAESAASDLPEKVRKKLEAVL